MSRVLSAVKFMRDLAVARGTDADDRIYMSVAPQDTVYPKIIMEVISAEMSPTQDTDSALDEIRIQVDVFAENTNSKSGFQTAHEIHEELRKAWSYQGGAEDIYFIDQISQENYRSDWFPDLNLQQSGSDWIIRIK